MKFRFRILSANRQRQRDARNFGLLLLIIGLCLHDPGHSSLRSIGIFLLLWSGLSWLTQKAWSAGWFKDTAWTHLGALALLILLDIWVGHFVDITKSAVITFSDQMLRKELSVPPEKRQPIAKFEHGSTIRSVAFSPVDASVVASAGGDTIKLWNQNAPDTPETLRLERYTDSINAIAFSPDGERLAAGGDRGLAVWSIPEKRFIQTFDDSTAVVAFSPDGQRIAGAAWDLNLWNITDNGNFKKTELFTHRTHDAYVRTIAFSPDGKWLVSSGGAQGEMKVWDIQSEQVAIRPLEGGNARVRSVKFALHETKPILASAGHDGDVKFWRTQDWQIGNRISTGTVLNLTFSPDGNVLASAGWDKVDLWSVKNGAHIISLQKPARTLAFSANGTTLATAGTDGTVRIWEVPQTTLPQHAAIRDTVRIVYFLPKDARPQLNIRAKIDKMIRKVQHFYAEEIESHRLERRSFVYETDQKRKARVYLVTGKRTAENYLKDTLTKVSKEIGKHFDMSRNVYFVVIELGSKRIENDVCGQARATPIWSGGKLWQVKAGVACIPTFKSCFNWQTAAHELGHAFGLKHDFRDDDYLMSYGRTPDRLSQSAAHWLSQTRFFKPNQQFFDTSPAIEMQRLSPTQFQFEITDADGIHQVQLMVVSTSEVPPSGYEVSRDTEKNKRSWEEYKQEAGFMLKSYYKVDGEDQKVLKVAVHQAEKIRIQVIDMPGNITWRTFNISEDSE